MVFHIFKNSSLWTAVFDPIRERTFFSCAASSFWMNSNISVPGTALRQWQQSVLLNCKWKGQRLERLAGMPFCQGSPSPRPEFAAEGRSTAHDLPMEVGSRAAPMFDTIKRIQKRKGMRRDQNTHKTPGKAKCRACHHCRFRQNCKLQTTRFLPALRL